MPDMTVQFRPSACGRYVVALIGAARPHVLPLDEAEAMAPLYRDAAARFSAAGQGNAARYELASATLLEAAVLEAKGRI
jgi:hypothetical protein